MKDAGPHDSTFRNAKASARIGRGRAGCGSFLFLACALVFSKPVQVSAAPDPAAAKSHWAFQDFSRKEPPPVAHLELVRTPVDRFVQARLERQGLSLGREAGRAALIRRVAFTLTGLPPTPEEIDAFEGDDGPGAYERMIERFLASHHYGECWGKYWLDTAGYANSNGYFAADSDRPLAYRYRDYVIRSLNRNKPFDAFVREQLAGDELSGWKPGSPATPETLELLEATHFLRNGQDGTGESDGNPDELRVDRYYALESTMQIIGSSLLGLTIQCAKCHDHKFEPFTQRDYYSLQAVLYPAFNIEKWTKPNDRVVQANLPGELEAWQAREKRLDAEQAALKSERARWIASHRPRGRILFQDAFDNAEPLAARWSNTAPEDDAPGGTPPVNLDSEKAPAAQAKDGALRIIEGGGTGDRWISTRQAFPWRPPATGDWIQVTFDLVAARLPGQKSSAERIGYFIALHDFNDNAAVPGGNILIDGNPGGPTSVHVDYPGADDKGRGQIGATGYKPGRNYGVRVTRLGEDKFRLEHLVDGAPDGGTVELTGEDLPPGGFGFEYCCGRSFVVDNVAVEASPDNDPGWTQRQTAFQSALAEHKREFEKQKDAIAAQRSPKPGRIAWVTDLNPKPPVVHRLDRGNPRTPGEPVEPSFPAFLRRKPDAPEPFHPAQTESTTGRRLAWARWLTEPGSRQAALLARVTVNRIWQHYFGVGLVATPDNLGLSGARPSHPELLEWLASRFVDSGWDVKALHRLLLQSAVFRQESAPRQPALTADPSDQLLWRFPLRRLDAEAIRDSLLAAGGRLDGKTDGPYVPTKRDGSGEVVVDESRPGAFARSIFLQQRRTQVATFLSVFDAPSIVFNCTRRATTTMPLQSLSLLNSDFAVQRARDLAGRLEHECGKDAAAKLQRAFLLTSGRCPDAEEEKVSRRFLDEQRRVYADSGRADADGLAWADFCQTLFGLNSFLYLE
jgi:Protein of unknown function (DUF1553)/Protein of unknown function (DUF1549)